MGGEPVVLQVPVPDGSAADAAVREVRLSSPDRLYFPDLGLTKLDIARYYLAVADGITRALHHRPCMLHRFPRGTTEKKVHQKKLPAGAPDWVQTVDIFFPRYSRTVAELCVTEPAAVVWAVQMSTVEFHPWNSRREQVERPDEWRIDLDPMPGADLARVRRVAHVAHEVLDELGIVGYPKTSGGRGLHIYVRIAPDWDFHDVRRAALAFGTEVARRLPGDATVTWWRKDRDPNAVFIDFNQNARDHTMAAAYSIRANARATVSAPLSWSEIDDAEPDDFTVTTMPGRYDALGDLHAGLDDRAHRLDTLLEWADRDGLAAPDSQAHEP
ncbi:non-homologous end-joining DNA ligase [Gordonia aichiensis]|uniref:non-homologous end-joining DNA ligase n=1 Tax=Gordonia aichiensis TaxID=36820 RepID=UPI003264C515